MWLVLARSRQPEALTFATGGRLKCSSTSVSRSSAALSSHQIQRFLDLQERHLRLKTSLESGADAAAIGTGAKASAVDTSTTDSTNTNGACHDFWERISSLALGAESRIDDPARPPLTSYVEVVDSTGPRSVATAEYRDWFCRTYGVARDEVAPPPPRTREPDSSDGAEPPADGWRRGRMKKDY